jgi:maleate isomerase
MKYSDALASRKKIGIVVPSTNTIVQPDSDDLRPRGVTNHVGRIPILERVLGGQQTYLEHMKMMSEGIGAAMDMVMTCQPDHMIMGVAIEAFQDGVEASNKLQKGLEDRIGVGVSMGAHAIVKALKAFGARRISVLTPHQPKGDEIVRTYLEEAGFDIVHLIGMQCASPLAIAAVMPDQLRGLINDLNGPDVEAIVQVGTNLSMVRLAASAEDMLDKPVIAINAVTYWDALRRIGIEDKIYGFGRTLEQF